MKIWSHLKMIMAGLLIQCIRVIRINTCIVFACLNKFNTCIVFACLNKRSVMYEDIPTPHNYVKLTHFI